MFAFHAFPKPCLKGAGLVFLYIKTIFICTPTKNRTVAGKEGKEQRSVRYYLVNLKKRANENRLNCNQLSFYESNLVGFLKNISFSSGSGSSPGSG
jgi:hypothetical protein